MSNSVDQKTPSVYFKNLDATRFLAASAVFIFHFSNEIRGLLPDFAETSVFKLFYVFASKGRLGVNFFFVLSGFLITYLILHERKHYGKFQLLPFLARRTLRIWPLYLFIVFIGFILFPLLIPEYDTTHQWENYVLFLANFDEIKYGATDGVNFLTAPWSVAVEEQFYLFWGLILTPLLLLRKFKIEWVIFLLLILSLVFRWVYWQDERTLYYHTLSVMPDILIGAFIGSQFFRNKKWINALISLKKTSVLLIYLIGFALCIGKDRIFIEEFIILERYILACFFAFIVIDQVKGKHSIFKLGRIKWFTSLGKISYGIYMYHLVVMFVLVWFINTHMWNDLLMISLFFILSPLFTLLIAYLSYHYFEVKFLSLKPKPKKHEN